MLGNRKHYNACLKNGIGRKSGVARCRCAISHRVIGPQCNVVSGGYTRNNTSIYWENIVHIVYTNEWLHIAAFLLCKKNDIWVFVHQGVHIFFYLQISISILNKIFLLNASISVRIIKTITQKYLTLNT